jgi:hypothetical protein
MSCILLLLVAIHVVFLVLSLVVPLALLLYQGAGYKEGNRVDYNMISIMTLSLLVYFIYICIDTIIYILRSTL